MNKIPLTIKELKSDTEFNYDVYTKEALISTIVSVRDYFSDLEKENQQLKEKLEASEKARKEAIEYVKKRNFDNAEILVDMECEYCYDDDFKDCLLNILDIDKGE